MGKLLYGTPPEAIEFDDRMLAHMKIVILTKLRRNEAFAMSWEHDQALGGGRATLWLHPAIPLQFKFSGSKQPDINSAWLEAMMLTANTAFGLRVLPESEIAQTGSIPVIG